MLITFGEVFTIFFMQRWNQHSARWHIFVHHEEFIICRSTIGAFVLHFRCDQALLNSIGSQRRGIVQIQFVHDVGTVFFYRFNADI
jgi:hypothetical protein